MRFIRIFLVLMLGFGVTACSKFTTYTGPEVTRVVVHKGERRMHLLHHDKVLRSYDIGLGFAPAGHKQFVGDGRTPEGEYRIDRRNPNSQFYLSLGIDYPRLSDIEAARALGKSPGGDIFIHGRANETGREFRTRGRDWTAGGIAVTNREMREIYAMVRDGTPISINP